MKAAINEVTRGVKGLGKRVSKGAKSVIKSSVQSTPRKTAASGAKDVLRLSTEATTRSSTISNPVKQKLVDGKPVFGSFVSSTDPMYSEIMGKSGVDYLFIDGEHTVLSLDQIRAHFLAAKATGTVPIVRVPVNNVDAIKQYLDAGAEGLIVSNVRTVADARKAVAAAYYPSKDVPEGLRRVGLGRASGYSMDLGNYVQQANDNMMLILMAEHKDMARNVDKILADTKGKVHGITMGPQDLAASLGKLGQPGDPLVQEHIRMFEEGARRHGVPLGTSVPDFAAAEKLMDKGYRFFTGPSDFEPVIRAARDWMTAAKGWRDRALSSLGS